MKNIVFCLSVLILAFSCQNNETNPESGAPINTEITEAPAEVVPTPTIFRLDTLIDFDSIVKIEVRNKEGVHDISPEKWEEIEYNIQKSIAILGLLCKRQEKAFLFTFKNGSHLEGYLCSGHINFNSTRIRGSFRLGEVLNFDEL